MEKIDIVVIGGGPAGLMAAGTAAAEGVTVMLLEKMEKVARKLRITGKGRCNITNARAIPEFLTKIYPSPNFFKPSLYSFSNQDIVTLLEKQGVKTYIDRGERIFPVSESAKEVAEGLNAFAKERGADILCHAEVVSIAHSADGFTISVKTPQESRTIAAKAVIVATGGLSYPLTGSTGAGYAFARELGVKVTPTHPSLVPLEMADKPGKLTNTTNLKNIEMVLWINQKKIDKEFGELEVLDGKLAGPITLRLSRAAVAAIDAGSSVRFTLDLKPALSPEQLDNRIARELANPAVKNLGGLLRTMLPSNLIDAFAELLPSPLSKPTADVSPKDKKAIVNRLREYPIDIEGYGGFSEAIVTAGGVDLKEIGSKTMESRVVGSLYFAGEVLNLDADTGGYNLQIAFSTGFVAGKSAAQKVKEANRADG
ncbi:BaiN/RdsA family NAD(P)/FAD-dependent oxidoreductase [Williamwhitmania taraxaci]|uniref:Aminoacetone oxidase family FAD-binding enzyme n=1 Tax=Williamwhitmania taraxaci TaxID=1640674 RepID=A0A1G6RMX1_9BACT|nr:NAD(P)/FAD-dependent oxidoreductase [Williamwhitmania taraxaci]SDD05898.1 hypothetical protein SAMN05216323_107713 [Williamwhitmania taraxaci]